MFFVWEIDQVTPHETRFPGEMSDVKHNMKFILIFLTPNYYIPGINILSDINSNLGFLESFMYI